MKGRRIKKSREFCFENVSVAFSACIISALIGIFGFSSLLFVACIERYGVSREEAALPFFLVFTVRSATGPLIGYFGKKFGPRTVILYGCILSATGIGACFFAEEMIVVNIFWGGVLGTGAGLATVFIPQIISQHFKKHNDKVIGLCLGGDCLSGFMIPGLFYYLVETYGLSGTYLVLSGIVLNAVPAAMILKLFIPSEKILQKSDRETNSFEDYNHIQLSNCKDIMPRDETTLSSLNVEKIVNDNNEVYQNLHTPEPKLIPRTEEKKKHLSCLTIQNENIFEEEKVNFAANYQKQWPTDGKLGLSLASIDKKPNFAVGSNFQVSQNHSILGYKQTTQSEETINLSNITAIKRGKSIEKKNSVNGLLRVFLDPVYICIMLTQSLAIFVVTAFYTILADFSRDINVSSYEEIYPVMVYSIADMLGRFWVGFITDSRCLSRITFSALNFASNGLMLVIFPHLNGLLAIIISVFISASLIGSNYIVLSGIILEYVQEENLSVAFSSRFLLYAPLSLTTSPLIGFFRERRGSYEGLFYLMGAIFFSCFILTLLIPIFARRKKMNSNSLGKHLFKRKK